MGIASFYPSMSKKELFISRNFFLRMVKKMAFNHKRYTKVGTDIEEVKRLNSQSGLSYNEVKKLLVERYFQKKQ